MKKIYIVLYDIVALIFAAYFSLSLRYDFNIPQYQENIPNIFLILLIIGGVFIYIIFDMYSSIWKFASVNELRNIILSNIFVVMYSGIIAQFIRFNPPRSWYIIFGFIILVLISLSRFFPRIVKHIKYDTTLIYKHNQKVKKVMIIGAGEAGDKIITEINSLKELNREVLCLIDDMKSKKGLKIKGVPIVGDRYAIKEVVKKYSIDEIIVALPSIKSKNEILKICSETGVNVKIIPGIYQLVSNEVKLSNLREINLEDLLGRPQINVNINDISNYLDNKVVLVTGGGGSIGSELCRQISKINPKMLIIVDIYENNAYEIQLELMKSFPLLKIEVMIASVRDKYKMDELFDRFRPEIVFHAAAHKHVPLMEDSPNEAVKNNVFGTLNVVKSSVKYNVRKFILISTDKAVNPTNVMGATKRICEMIVQNENEKSNTEFVAVRFGNVLGSNGSVIHLFKKQIKQGGPITVTHPDITRFFMTIPEAVGLVLQAGAYANGGEIFVLDMGNPVKIVDLAKNMIALNGLKLDEDIKIEFSGLRPGEKLYEELLMDEEGLRKTPNELIKIGKPIIIKNSTLIENLELLKNEVTIEGDNTKQLLKNLVETYNFEDKIN